jgi:predicted regulator of Ras-like GTPase activity (Roadblock/LC7/MglB family)
MATLIKQELSAAWSGVRLIRLNEECAALLTELEKIPGVQTAFICDNHGKVLGALSTATFDRGIYNTVGANLARIIAAFQARGGGKDFELRFEQKIVCAREMGNAFVVVVMTPGTSLSLLRMTLNVSASRFEADPELQTNLKNAAPLRAGALTQNSMSAPMWLLAQKAGIVNAG